MSTNAATLKLGKPRCSGPGSRTERPFVLVSLTKQLFSVYPACDFIMGAMKYAYYKSSGQVKRKKLQAVGSARVKFGRVGSGLGNLNPITSMEVVKLFVPASTEVFARVPVKYVAVE